jgi:hypothetical protein
MAINTTKVIPTRYLVAMFALTFLFVFYVLLTFSFSDQQLETDSVPELPDGPGGPDVPVVPAGMDVAECREQVSLNVYMEAGCPDSNRFYSQVFSKVSPGFTAAQLKVDHLPFGNAEVLQSDRYGLAIACQHGSEECRTNTFMACSRLLFPATYHNYVTCLMGNGGNITATYLSVQSCAVTAGIGFKEIFECVARRKGVKEMAKLAEETMKVHHDFIPWITINGDGGASIQDSKFEADELNKVVCSSLCQESKPAHCS